MSTILRGSDNIDSAVIVETNGLEVKDNAIARFDGTTGKLQGSGVTIDDSNDINFPLSSARRNITFRRDDSIGNIGQIAFNIADNTRASIIAHRHTAIGQFTDLEFNVSGNGIVMDYKGNLLLRSGTGAIGHGTGAGGVVTQLTSKGTEVTLNKPSGRIITHNAALAAGASVTFIVNNSLTTTNDYPAVHIPVSGTNYSIESKGNTTGTFQLKLTNISTLSLSDSVEIHFNIIKGVLV